MNAIEILIRYKDEFLYGLMITLKLSISIWIVGIILGTLIGVLGARWKIWVGIPTRYFSMVIGAIPILVILFWLHYPLQNSMNIQIDGFYTAIIALSIVNTFLIADLIRNSLSNFPNQYIIASQVLGLKRKELFFKIQIPIIIRQVLPSILILQVTMLQSTLFASLISVDEIFRIAQRVNSEIYRPVEIYTSLAILFILICLPLNGLAAWFKRKYSRDLSEKL